MTNTNMSKSLGEILHSTPGGVELVLHVLATGVDAVLIVSGVYE